MCQARGELFPPLDYEVFCKHPNQLAEFDFLESKQISVCLSSSCGHILCAVLSMFEYPRWFQIALLLMCPQIPKRTFTIARDIIISRYLYKANAISFSEFI